MAEELGLSTREIVRAGVLGEVVAGRLRQRQAAERLGISTRQVKRLVKRYRAEGAVGLRSTRRGRPSNRRHSDLLRQQVLALVAERYVDFGPTLLAEYLAKDHAIRLVPETLRQWLIAAGRLQPKKQRRSTHRARSRRPRFGELVQIDGSPHDWLEGRGARCTMIVFIDDATSRVLYGRFVPAETTRAYFDGFLAHLSLHGSPLAYYSDRHSIFRGNQPDAPAGPTQVERALQALEIELICAHSPQAKGRVERVHQTFQDRLVKALRLAKISDIDAANAFLETYLPQHNQRFAKPAHNPEDAHRPLTLDAVALARLLSPQHARRVDRQGAVRYAHRAYQLDRRCHRRHIGRTLTIVEGRNGIELLDGQRLLSHTVFDLKNWRAQVADRKTLDAKLDQATAKPPPPEPAKPAAHHPWRRPILTAGRPTRRNTLPSQDQERIR